MNMKKQKKEIFEEEIQKLEKMDLLNTYPF